MFFLILGLSTSLAQLCKQTNDIDSYLFQSGWTFSNIASLSGSSCSVPLSNAKVFTTSDIALYDVKLSLQVPGNFSVTINSTAGPQQQYKTDQLRLIALDTEIITYQSHHFQFIQAEHQFDFMPKVPDAELQVFFIQEQLYNLCDEEPIYAILSIPIYALYTNESTRDQLFTIHFDQTLNLTTFDFRNNITGAIKTDSVSVLSYQAPIDVPPCGLANWYALTLPLFIKQNVLTPLLTSNKQQTLQRQPVTSDQQQAIKKGKFVFYYEDIEIVQDDTVQWVATWVASIIPCVAFALVVCIYGQYELSLIGRYKRPQEKKDEQEMALKQNDDLDKQLA